jgi:hypothetical protein
VSRCSVALEAGYPSTLERPTQGSRAGFLPFHGTERGRIFESVKGLDAQPEFAGAIDMVETTNDVSSFISDVTAAFAGAFLANPAANIAFVHAVTAPSGLRLLVPYVSEAAASPGGALCVAGERGDLCLVRG